MSKRLEFENLHNTRDLGGMKTADGRTVRPGRLFRSGHLSDLTSADARSLTGLIDCAVDFRTDQERSDQPDRVMDGVDNIHIPIMESLTPGISREEESDEKAFMKYISSPDAAKKYMCDVYRAFTSDYAVKQYGDFIKLLAENRGRTLWHCTAGKDRAGIASVLVEEILGVPRADIIRDYIKTNEYIKDDVSFLKEFVKRQSGNDSPAADEALQYLFGAEEDYIQTFYKAVDEKYGTFDAFLREGLGVSHEIEEELKKKYLFRKMRRFKQQISEEDCIRLLKDQPRGVLSMIGDEGYPYGIPLDHWYSEKEHKLYFHCAKTGHKMDAIAACDKVSYCVMDQGWRREGEWALNINSLVLFGRMRIVEDEEKKREICTNLTRKFTQDEEYLQKELEKAFSRVTCLELTIEHMTGKLVNES